MYIKTEKVKQREKVGRDNLAVCINSVYNLILLLVLLLTVSHVLNHLLSICQVEIY